MGISAKQRFTIKRIEANLGITFTGTTMVDASAFIGQYIDESMQIQMEDECNGYGLPNQ